MFACSRGKLSWQGNNFYWFALRASVCAGREQDCLFQKQLLDGFPWAFSSPDSKLIPAHAGLSSRTLLFPGSHPPLGPAPCLVLELVFWTSPL